MLKIDNRFSYQKGLSLLIYAKKKLMRFLLILTLNVNVYVYFFQVKNSEDIVNIVKKAKNTLELFAPEIMSTTVDLSIPNVILSTDFPKIVLSRPIYNELIDMVKNDRSATSTFRKLMWALVPDEKIWQSLKAKELRLKFAAEYGAAKGKRINNFFMNNFAFITVLH